MRREVGPGLVGQKSKLAGRQPPEHPLRQACQHQEVGEWRAAVKAVEWWERAALEAVESGAPTEAMRMFQRAADIAEVRPCKLGPGSGLHRVLV